MSDHAGEPDLDAAVSRLEDVLLGLPDDRALPDLDVLLDRAGVPTELLRRDERLLKVLYEAALARPYGHRDEVDRVRSEVELLVLEVEVLTDRLRDPETSETTVHDAVMRLEAIHGRLAELLADL